MERTDIGRARVLITGASSGIGAATAHLLAELGATLGLVGRRQGRLAAVLADCRIHDPKSRMWVTDLADLDGAERLAIQAWEELGGIDVLVNNAAVPKVRSLGSLAAADVEHAMQVNFFSPVRMTLALLPRMLARRGGVIVNVSSVGGRLGISHEAAYSASKFALCGWSESLAVDLHGSGVTVRLIQPGPIDTDIWDRPDEPKAVYDGPKESPDLVARAIVEAICGERFEHYVPDLKAVVTGKDADIDGYIAFAAAMSRDADGKVVAQP